MSPVPYSVPTTFAAGNVLTAAQMNVLGADIVALANPPKCRVFNSGAISLTSGVAAALTFDSERFDIDTMHSTITNTNRVTFTTAGTYEVGCAVAFAAAATGIRQVQIRLNGTTVIASDTRLNATATYGLQVAVSTLYAFGAGNYIEFLCSQDSGGAVNIAASGNYSPEAWAIWRSL